MTGIEEPKWTQIPNVLLDTDMASMSEAELKCTLAILRRIVGYHREKPEPVSYSLLQTLTGLSRQAVIDGITAAVARGRVCQAGTGGRGVKLYTVNFVDQSTEETSLKFRPVDDATCLNSSQVEVATSQQNRPVNAPTSQPSRPDLVYSVDPLNKEKEIVVVADGSLSQQQQIARAPEAPNPALGDDPPAPPAWSEHETAIIQAECDRIGFNGLGLESLRAREAETALGLLYQVQTDGVRNPGGLLVEMLRAHSVPAAKHLKRAAYVLADADGSAPYEEPEEREDSAEHSTPDAAPPPAESITATGEPERGPEPAAPVGDGLDTVIAGRQVLELWRSALAQCRIEPDFFAAWFTDCQPMSYANGVLTVRPHDAEAQMRTGLYTPILNANLSRLAGTALRVQWFWPAPSGGAVEVKDKLAEVKQEA